MQRKQIFFKGQNIFIGIDVHKNSWSVAVTPEIGAVRVHVQKPSAQELIDFLRKNYPEGTYNAVYESGFSGFSTYYALQEVGINCIVTHAADVPTTQYEESMKTDRVDSAKLARSLKAGFLKGIYIHRKDDIDNRSVVRLRMDVQRQMSGCKSRIKHLLHCNGVGIPERFASPGTHWSRAFVKWLAEDVRLLSASRNSLDLLLVQLEGFRTALLAATGAVRRLSQSARYKEQYALLTSIPGIGVNVAMTILTEIGEFTRFRNEREFASYLGLIPTSHSSGEKTAHGEKTFRGNKRVGTLLVEAAWVAIYRDRWLGCAYTAYTRKMEPQKAIIRIARKMSNVILAVIKTGRRYEPYEQTGN